MLRQLLTLLALITGLAATSAPVEARAPAADGAQIELSDIGSGVIAAELAMRATPSAAKAFSAPENAVSPLPAVLWRAPAVLYGPDRAHE